MFKVGMKARDRKTGLVGKVIRIIEGKLETGFVARLIIVRLDPPDPLFGSVLSAFEEDLDEVENPVLPGLVN